MLCPEKSKRLLPRKDQINKIKVWLVEALITFLIASFMIGSLLIATFFYNERLIKLNNVKSKGGVVDNYSLSRMKFHGIWPHGPFPKCDEKTNVCIFERDGKKVRIR